MLAFRLLVIILLSLNLGIVSWTLKKENQNQEIFPIHQDSFNGLSLTLNLYCLFIKIDPITIIFLYLVILRQ